MSQPSATAELLLAIRALPRAERLRLVAQVAQDLALEETSADAGAVFGCMADDTDALDQAVETAMKARESLPLRTRDA